MVVSESFEVTVRIGQAGPAAAEHFVAGVYLFGQPAAVNQRLQRQNLSRPPDHGSQDQRPAGHDVLFPGHDHKTDMHRIIHVTHSDIPDRVDRLCRSPSGGQRQKTG